MEALARVLQEANLEFQLELRPPISYAVEEALNRTGILLADEISPARAEQVVSSATQNIAAKITRINDTTRTRFEREIRNGLEDKLTVRELVSRLRENVMPMSHARSLTIARTEASNAWAQGSVAAFKESSTLEYLSVIGCDGEEPKGPQYKGRSSCNYPDLPVTELDAFMEVGFHPNHTGCICPSGFRED